jgi:ABC-type xylose transport system permease subunit
MLATVRPDDIDLALLVHVAGAMVLVGGLVTTVGAAALGWRGDLAALRLSSMSLFAITLPGWLVMRVGGQWVYSEESLDDLDPEPAWIGVGYLTADLGFVLLVVALILAGIGVRRSRRGGGTGLMKASAVLGGVLLAAYIVAVWAMGAKPD